MAALDVALRAHLHRLRIVGSTRIVMKVRPCEPVATADTPSRLFHRRGEPEEIPVNRAGLSVQVRKELVDGGR